MKRLLLWLLTFLTCLMMVSCGSLSEAPQSVLQSTITTLASTVTGATVLTTASSTTTGIVSDPTSGAEQLRVSQPFADKNGLDLSAKLPWAAAPKASFYSEVSYERGNAFEVFFTADEYEFMRGYMADTTFVLDDGTVHKQKDLQHLVDKGEITPDELVAVFSLEPKTKAAVDTVSKESCFGKMITYRRDREAVVKKDDAEAHIYPPFDFIGEFYKDDSYRESLGYYINATYLNQLLKATCSSVGTVDSIQGIRVGEALFIPVSAAERIGVTISVGEKGEEIYRTPSLKILLPDV